MRDLLFLLDTQGRIISTNQAVRESLEYPDEELVGKPFETVLAGPAKDKNHLMAPLKTLSLKEFEAKTVIRSGNVLGMPTGSHEIALIRKDGSSILVEIRTYLMKICEEKIIFGIARDISLEKKAEEKKLQLERELQHTQKMEAVSRLAGGIAHDFNNLLGGIVGYADLLCMKLSTSLPAEAATAQKIVDIARKISRLTSQLLAFSRKGKYQVQAIDLHACIYETAQILEKTISRKISIAKKLEASSAVVIGDRSQLQNAFLNLGINACDAMPDGGTLTFESSTFDLDDAVARLYPYKVNPGTFIKISVIDTGIGMDAETRECAFEPFFSTKTSGKGTGLGLASVYGTVKNHSGFINLWSEKGKGTAIIICLPVTTASPATREVANATGGFHTMAGRILIIDDEKIIRDMASDALTMLGYIVTSCADGNEAVAKFRAQSGEYDLVLLDLTMPGMSGLECLKELRSINARIRFIISSGYAFDNEISTILKDDTVTFLQKPFDVRVLSDAVRRALGA